MRIEACFKEYSDAMTRAMTAFTGDDRAAEDAVQQAFMKALMNSAMLEAAPEPAIKAWLYAAARNAAVDVVRKRSRLVYEASENIEYVYDDPSDRMFIHSLLEKLPAYLSEPVEMKYYAGMNSTEIGRVLELPPATVRTRLRTAVSMMRDMMKGERNNG